MPASRQARATRTAISPRFAIRTARNGAAGTGGPGSVEGVVIVLLSTVRETIARLGQPAGQRGDAAHGAEGAHARSVCAVAEVITDPARIPVPGGKVIDEYVGRVASGDDAVSVARMAAPRDGRSRARRPSSTR